GEIHRNHIETALEAEADRSAVDTGVVEVAVADKQGASGALRQPVLGDEFESGGTKGADAGGTGFVKIQAIEIPVGDYRLRQGLVAGEVQFRQLTAQGGVIRPADNR